MLLSTEERKQRKRNKVRNEIMDAATRVIAKKGFHQATTKEIAEEADIAEGTLYNYFKNKNDILMNIANRYVSEKRNFMISADVNSVEDLLVQLHKSNEQRFSERFLNDRNALKALVPAILTDKVLGNLYYEDIVKPYLETLEKHLKKLQDKGRVIDFDVQALSRLIYASLIGYAILDINGDPLVNNPTPEFRKQATDSFIEVFSKGMRAEKY